MTIKPVFKAFATLVITGMMMGANAFNISFDSDLYIATPGTEVEVTVNFDFIDNPAFGGGFNVLYDPTVLEFLSYTQAPFVGPGAPQAGEASSPLGTLASPGNYLNAGVGTFDFFTGINTAGAVGTFVFTVLGAGGDAGCGATLCLTPVASSPVFNLVGQDITFETFANGISAATVVPIPAAVWFMLSGLGALLGFRRRSA